uniref:Golgi apparatus membrane protein TVP38 n=1 Tax=Kalmanozyma brasiliensis (strain GHG001) TaxID=1365824 RepID=V5EX50_KALBG
MTGAERRRHPDHLGAMPARSPLSLRAKQSSQDERSSQSDDEAGKGHGRKATASTAARFTPSIHHPRHQHAQQYAHFNDKGYYPAEASPSITADIAWRASISESRRATPAAYRPRPNSANRRRTSLHVDQQPLGGEDSTDMQLPGGHKSTHSSIMIGSPLVIPQARRGAVRLRPRRKRKIARQIKPQRTLRQNVLVFVSTIAHFIRLLASPLEASRRFREYCIDTRIAIDEAFRDPQTGMRSFCPPWLQAYVPLLIWLGISLSSTALVITFHTEVFVGLDHMSTYLQGLGLWGKVMLGSLIFLTTFPPLPLYSTLIMLCGFTFGLWQGFIISYIAALSGAIVVFVLSRSLLREWMVGLLNKSGGLKKVVRAIEKQPKLLFLVRLAPYPYNLMNTLLASSPTLTMRTYVTCTALALPKLLIHTGLGTSIKNFAAYNGAAEGQSKEDAEASRTAENVKKWAGLIGAGLCFGIMIYLLSVARRAVDDLDDEDEDGLDDELYDDENEALLSSDEDEDGHDRGDTYEHGPGVDMRERAGPSTLGFRNGYAPIESSPEERFRQSMRHPIVAPGPLVLPNASFEGISGTGSYDGRISLSNSGSGGHHSIDLADKIAEMEAHAENMQFESPSHRGAEEEEVAVELAMESPKWSPMIANLEASAETNDTVHGKPFSLDQEDEHGYHR